MKCAMAGTVGRRASTGSFARGFSIFAEELHLAYLRRHCAWGGPARIPPEAWAWTPTPCPAQIAPAAERAFAERVETAARAVAPECKRGGLTYAAEVRRLYDALAAVLTDVRDGPLDVEPCPPFALARIGEGWEIGLVGLDADTADRAPGIAPPAPRAASARTTSRRETLGLAALLPGAFLARPRPVIAAAGEPAAAIAEPEVVARVAGALEDLERLPWRDRHPLRRVPGRDAWEYVVPGRDADARLRELGIGPFVTAGALARRLAETLTAAADMFTRQACARDIAHADRADHVRYHAATADRLIARLRRYAAAGTHWAGPHAGGGWSWDGLVCCASFDLRNFAGSLGLREACVREAGDPLTFPDELQVALDPFLFRRDTFGSRLIGSTLCARLRPHAGEATPASSGVTYVCLLDEGLGPPASRTAAIDIAVTRRRPCS